MPSGSGVASGIYFPLFKILIVYYEEATDSLQSISSPYLMKRSYNTSSCFSESSLELSLSACIFFFIARKSSLSFASRSSLSANSFSNFCFLRSAIRYFSYASFAFFSLSSLILLASCYASNLSRLSSIACQNTSINCCANLIII